MKKLLIIPALIAAVGLSACGSDEGSGAVETPSSGSTLSKIGSQMHAACANKGGVIDSLPLEGRGWTEGSILTCKDGTQVPISITMPY